ncbi:MAG: hypothetical protein ABI639_14525 [Thermoanaerobaculia bacterium]
MTEYCRDRLVLVKWKFNGRTCLLLKAPGEDVHEGYYEPAKDAVAGPLQALAAAALESGLTQLRLQVLAARRVILAGIGFATALQRAASRADIDLDGFSDVAEPYNRALHNFERTFGKGTPMTEDLTR